MTALAYGRIGAGRVRSADETAESRRRTRAFWHRCDYARGTLAERYLARRGIGWVAGCECIRFRPDCPHPGGGTLPALVCLVLDADGNIAAVHRTFLAADGGKAAVEPVKASMGSFAGCAIRLHPACPSMLVGEGLETTASAAVMLGLPGWAAIACGNLAGNMRLPALVRSVTVAADNDMAGQDAARAAARRWRAEGRTVRIATPDTPGQDFNDVLRTRARARGGPWLTA